MSICVVIPTYNCANQITRTLKQFTPEISSLINEIIVIDNHSSDNTIKAAQSVADSITAPFSIYHNTTNMNLGGSLKNGFDYAIERYTHVLVMHGDDQAQIQDFKETLKHLSSNESDLIIGARFHPDSILSGYSKMRILGNRLLNTYFRCMTGKKIDDLIAGLNIYRCSFLANHFYQNFPNDLTFDANLLLYAVNQKAAISFVPISWSEVDQKSNAKIYRQGWILLRLFTRYGVLRSSALKRYNRPEKLPPRLPMMLVYSNKQAH